MVIKCKMLPHLLYDFYILKSLSYETLGFHTRWMILLLQKLKKVIISNACIKFLHAFISYLYN